MLTSPPGQEYYVVYIKNLKRNVLRNLLNSPNIRKKMKENAYRNNIFTLWSLIEGHVSHLIKIAAERELTKEEKKCLHREKKKKIKEKKKEIENNLLLYGLFNFKSYRKINPGKVKIENVSKEKRRIQEKLETGKILFVKRQILYYS